MRCPYCFQVIEERSQRCPHCGSRLPKVFAASRTLNIPVAKEDAATPSLGTSQLLTLLGGTILLLACLCAGLVGLVRPALLPQPVIAAVPFLATSAPLPTRQVTRAAVPTATPVVTEVVCSRRAEFCLTFPPGWLVLDQGLPGWQRDADSLAETYRWLPALFNTAEVPRVARLRAAPPALVNPSAGRLARLTAGETKILSPTLTLDEIETRIQTRPDPIVALVAPPLMPGASVRRLTRERLGGYQALATELEGKVGLVGPTIPVRARIYLLPVDERLYALGYLADETTIAGRRELFEQIVQSFEVEE